MNLDIAVVSDSEHDKALSREICLKSYYPSLPDILSCIKLGKGRLMKATD